MQCLLLVAPSLLPQPDAAGSELSHSPADFQEGSTDNTTVESGGVLLERTAGPDDWICLGDVFSPPAVCSPALGYDPENGTFVLVGRSETPDETRTHEAWRYNSTADRWTRVNMTNAMPGDVRYGGVYDSAGKRMVFCSKDATKTYTFSLSGSNGTWANADPAASPPARINYSMAFDDSNGVVMLFGGEVAASGHFPTDTWTYDPVANTWTNRTPAQSPPGRANARLAYDGDGKVVVLFGGSVIDQGGRVLLNDTWVYDPVANTWTNESPPGSPPGRELFGMAYYPEMGETVLNGGVVGDRTRYGNDTWSYHLAKNTWTDRTTKETPPPRCHQTMAYDPGNGTVVMAGGLSPPDFNWRADSWNLDFDGVATTWTMGTLNAPSWRTGAHTAYEDDTGELYMFGGYDGAYVWNVHNSKLYCGDTWKYNVSDGRWELLSPKKACQKLEPRAGMRISYSPEGSGSTMAYDGRARQLILFGPTAGSWDSPQNRTFVFDIPSNSWTEKFSTGITDTMGGVYSMACNADTGGILLFESRPGGTKLYAYNSSQNAWTEIRSGGPGTFEDACMVFLESTKEMLLYGRSGSVGESWLYNRSQDTWTKLQDANDPTLRIQFSMVYDSFRDEVVLSGGHEQGPPARDLNDTWCYNVSAKAWRKLDPKNAHPKMSCPTSFYHGPRNEVLMLGGIDGSGNSFPFLWSFDRRLYRQAGNFTSAANDTGGETFFGNITWEASVPDGTRMGIQLRSGNTREELENKTFTGPDGTGNSFFTASGARIPGFHNGTRWIQYRVTMDSASEWRTPVLEGLRISMNRLHNISLIVPNATSDWTDEITIRWDIDDPDGDGFNCVVEYLDPNGTATFLDNVSARPYNYRWSIPRDISGPGRIRLTATDNNTDIPLARNITSAEINLLHSNHRPQVWLATPDNYVTVTCSTVQLNWTSYDPEGDQLQYEVFLGTEEFFDDCLPARSHRTNETSYNVTDLDDKTTYFWSVIANDGIENSSLPEVSRFFVELLSPPPTNHPPEVRLLSPQDGEKVTDVRTRLSWNGTDADRDVLTYYVFLAGTVFGLSTLPSPLNVTGETFQDLSGLVDGETYYWTVIASDGKDYGTIPGIWTFTVRIVIPADTPIVTNCTPKGTNVPLNPTISVTFDREMDVGSVGAAFSSDPPIGYGGFLLIPKTTTFQFFFSGPLQAGTTYNLTIGTLAKSGQGKNMYLPYNWSFTTLAAGEIDVVLPTVLLRVPKDGSINVDQWLEIQIVFSEAMAPVEAGSICSVNPPVAGVWQWMSNRTSIIQFSSGAGFANGTYCVTISSSAKDLSGNPLDGNNNGKADGAADDIVFAFTVGTPLTGNPRLLTWSPNGTGIHTDSELVLAFDRRMDTDSVERAFRISPAMDGHWTVDGEAKVFTFTPDRRFQAGTTYRISVGTGARDIFGNPLETEYAWSFTTVLPSSQGWTGAMWWLLLVVMVLLLAGVAAAYASLRRRAAAGTAGGDAPATAPKGFAVEDIFLMYNDGRLIQHLTRRIKADLDADILASMLTALQGFVNDSVGRETGEELGSMEYGGNKILLERGRHVIVAAVITGGEPAGFRDEMRAAVRNIESEHGAVLEGWDGTTSRLAGTRKFLSSLGGYRAPEEPVPGAPGTEVSLKSELEFYQGFVRLKVAVKNRMDTMIARSSFKLVYNDHMLRLDHVEPALDLKGDEVVLGIIEPGEKKTMAFYLDPQICTESYIEGVLTFKDARGNLETVKMPRKLASVVCPVLFTDENINTAMLKRMAVEELDKKDSKVFTIPSTMDPERAFEIGKAAVRHHDVRLVREFREEKPFRAEAWYYGKAKGRPERLVVRVRVIPEMTFLEFSVSSDSVLMLTGMLAELKTDLNNELESARLGGAMRQVTDREDVEAVAEIRLLLEKAADTGDG